MLTDSASDSVHDNFSDDNAFDASPLAKETAKDEPGRLFRQKRSSVRDLARKFDKEQVTTRPVTEKGKVMGSTLCNRDAQFHKLRLVVTDLRVRLSGRSDKDVEEALSAITVLLKVCTQQESELDQERGEIRMLSRLFKHYSGDARNLIEEAYAVAKREIESIKEVAARIQDAFHEHEQTWAVTEKDLEELKRESDEARRIKLLHESHEGVNMEYQINNLRQQLIDKALENAMLRKELETFKWLQQGGPLQRYCLSGLEQLGTILSFEPLDCTVRDLSRCTIQWYRISPDGSAMEIISGAIRPQYAPEPFDVGRRLRAEIVVPCGKTVGVQTARPIDPAPDLDNYVEILVIKGGAQFNVRIVLKNGEMVKKQSLHMLDVSRTHIELRHRHVVKAKEIYSSSMQLCGARGGGDSAAQALFWVAVKGVTFMLVLESQRERNAAILLARRFATLKEISLRGPGDVMPLEGSDLYQSR